MKYNWQQTDWPHFRYDLSSIEDLLFAFAEKIGRINGMLSGLSEDMQMEAIIAFMVAEAIKTSEIEGEYVSRQDVMSSIRHNFGLKHSAKKIQDKNAEGIAKLTLDVHQTFKQPLTQQKLFNWHKMLLPNIKSLRPITIGKWRTHQEPMQVISGRGGKLKVHFEAPPSKIIAREMRQFMQWFNDTSPGQPHEIKFAPVRSAIAHLYFESIHPFEDGNGRIGRAIAEKALSQGLQSPVLFSLSQAIEANKKAYYAALKNAQKSNEITSWIYYFVNTILSAQTDAETHIKFILQKAQFFDRYKATLNDRQIKVMQRMLDEGPKGFVGGMSAKKYIAITKTSKATATRDLQCLLDLGILQQVGSGRSTHYVLQL